MRSSYVLGTALVVLAFVVVLLGYTPSAQPGQTGNSPVAVYCAPSFDTTNFKKGKAPLIDGLGNLHFPVTTRSKLAQRFFNQGLTLVYAFNHGEAARSFQEMLRNDSTAAMGWWGMAMVLGPNYNAALNPSSLEEINTVMRNAQRFAAKATPKEQAMIAALARRFPAEPVSDMGPFAAAYADGMRQVNQRFPDDADIAVLYADALMNEHPWNFYLRDGEPQPWTKGVEQVLEQTMARFPNHPGALHMYLHAVEASPTASRALPAAKRLLNMVPAAGHLVHMPAHIYIRTGHYHDGVLSTEQAQVSDSSYIVQCKSQGTYPLLYYPHNVHFLAACAFLEGNSQKAIAAAWNVSRLADRRYLATNVTVQHYYIIPYYVLVHLGEWQQILSIPTPGESLQYPRAIWHYARGMAYTATGNLPAARQELASLQGYAADTTLRPLLVWETNSSLDLIGIAAFTLEAELLAHERQYDRAIERLRKAAAIEDGLNYQEPPDWFFSVRHSLGHVLVQAKKFAEAEQVYLEDFKTFPENGWALRGLYSSLVGQQKHQEAEAVRQRFEKAWQWADIKITSSRKY